MKHRSFEKYAAASCLVAALGLWSQRADACGGFFCSQQQPVNQAAERIIFADNGDGTITAVIQILYEGPSESFSWLLPISSVPQEGQLGVASDLAFTRLQAATNPQFNLTTVVEGTCRSRADDGFLVPGVSRETCEDNPLLAGCEAPLNDAEGSPIGVEASGVVGAFEYSVISVDPALSDPVAPALEWLGANGYDVPPESAGLLGPYLAEGMYLLALRLTKGSDTGSIRPIRLTYEAEAPMIPIKLTAVAANRDMGVMTWALSSARAVPFNYNGLELNEARINWFNAASNYGDVVTQAANAAGGQGFVTEFAGPSSLLADVVWRQDEESDWQSVKAATYFDFESMFLAAFNRYQSFSGFWDAARRSVALPEGVSFEDFKLCPGCYWDDASLVPTEFFAAIEADVIEPLRGVQDLIDRAPYTTRLYSTLSADEMTVDPVFVFNADLPDVSNIHTANRVIECDSGVYESEAPWRIDFPQGSVIRGTPDTVGQWPDAVGEQPPNLRVLTLAASGEGAVLTDNAELINELLASYNASVPGADGTAGPMRLHDDDSGLCSLSAGPRPASPPVPLALGLGALLGAGLLRRRARPQG